MKRPQDTAADDLLESFRALERVALLGHRENYHPLEWLRRAERCGLITKEQADECRQAAAPFMERKTQVIAGVPGGA